VSCRAVDLWFQQRTAGSSVYCRPNDKQVMELFELEVEALTFTVPPDATASAPFWLHSSSVDPPLVVHCLTAPFQFRQSHTFTVPSWPAVAIYLPPVLGSTETLTTGPRCANSRTAGWGKFGVHNVTVPFWCPRCITALCKFCAIVVHAPSFVRCSVKTCPVDVSWYFRYPVWPFPQRQCMDDA
jgi:hypothetical protein